MKVNKKMVGIAGITLHTLTVVIASFACKYFALDAVLAISASGTICSLIGFSEGVNWTIIYIEKGENE